MDPTLKAYPILPRPFVEMVRREEGMARPSFRGVDATVVVDRRPLELHRGGEKVVGISWGRFPPLAAMLLPRGRARPFNCSYTCQWRFSISWSQSHSQHVKISRSEGCAASDQLHVVQSFPCKGQAACKGSSVVA